MKDRINPLVSISCITYNHAPYIKKCLDGFLMQKTNFEIEILIHDDASTDGTEQIIRDYEKKHPTIFKPLYETENQWLKGRRGSKVFNFPRSRGKYIALCEGDDYWTDPYKLQKQVDFLENNPDFVISFTDYNQTVEGSNSITNKTNLCDKETLSIDDLLVNNYVSTLTCIFRNNLFKEFPIGYNKLKVGDWPLHVLNARYGKIKYHKGWTTGVYRIHEGGVWSGEDKLTKYIAYAEVHEFFKEVLEKKYHNQIIQKLVDYYYYAASTLLERNDQNAAKEVIEKMFRQSGILDTRYLKLKIKQIFSR